MSGAGRKEGHQVGPFVVLCPGVSLAGQARPFLSFFFFKFLFILFYLFDCAGSLLWHVGSSSLTRD